jgi:molecular chaperone DnaK (HSP70)
VGVDPGSYKTVIGAIEGKGVKIVLSESSGNSTPTITAYTDAERVIGDSAKSQIKKNFKNTL